MANDTDPETTNSTVMRAKTAVIATALSTQAKVDENRLRKAREDRLPELLKMVEELRKTLPKRRLPPLIDGS
jgi:hypothetical protein